MNDQRVRFATTAFLFVTLFVLMFASPLVESTDVRTGRYLVRISGCNDCHTPGWSEAGGQVREEDWLTGSPIGWRGPWGTTYASNLRRLVDGMSEDAWVAMLRSRTYRPPMPWSAVNSFTESDSRAVYRFIKSLGVRGDLMPAAVGPETDPATPYFRLEPVAPMTTQ